MKLIRIGPHVINMDQVLKVEYGKETGNQYAVLDLAAPYFVPSKDDEEVDEEMTSIFLEGVNAILFIRWLERNAEDIGTIPVVDHDDSAAPSA